MSGREVTQARSKNRQRRTWIIVGAILLAALAVNGVAYRLSRRTPDAAGQPPAGATAPGDDGNEGLARARRAAGIAALEHKDYDKAISELTEALRLRKDKGDLGELLNIAQELRTRESGRATPARVAAAAPSPPPPEPAPAPTPAPRPEPPRQAPKSKPTRVATRAQPERAQPEPPPAPEPPRNGLLLVTSTPPGLVVMVDGKATDLTPARLQVKAGMHRVALAQGERKVFDETVEVDPDAVRPVNFELKAEASPNPVVTAAATPSPAPAVVPASSRPPPAPAPAPAPPAEIAAKPPATGTGDLEITSPSLYGEVWVNDRPFGFPPVVARGLPAGKARIEVRVQGAVKRKMTVDVESGRRTPVRVR